MQGRVFQLGPKVHLLRRTKSEEGWTNYFSLTVGVSLLPVHLFQKWDQFKWENGSF